MPSIINALTAAGGGVAISGDATGNLALQTAGTTAMTIDTSQNVGIGTASPTTKLDVSGTTKATTLQTATLNSTSGVLATQNGMTGIAKAWVMFLGASTPTINSSFNVSSITQSATGLFAINFTTAMPNANYAIAGISSAATGDTQNFSLMYSETTLSTASTANVIVKAAAAGNFNRLQNSIVVFSS